MPCSRSSDGLKRLCGESVGHVRGEWIEWKIARNLELAGGLDWNGRRLLLPLLHPAFHPSHAAAKGHCHTEYGVCSTEYLSLPHPSAVCRFKSQRDASKSFEPKPTTILDLEDVEVHKQPVC